MSEYAHGANVADFARSIGACEGEIIDFSSNINFVKPNVKAPTSLSFLTPYESDGYALLKGRVSARYNTLPDNIELYNGASAAIFSLFGFLRPREVFLYAPIYLEYKRAARVFGIETVFVDRFAPLAPPPAGSTVVFVNPATPDGTLYDAKALLAEWKRLGCNVVMDESFLDFCDGESLMTEAESYDKLYVIKSLTKYFGAAGVRVGFIASASKNIEAIKAKEPLWKLSSFDAYYMDNALADADFNSRSKTLNESAKKTLECALEESALFEGHFDSKANFVCAKLKPPYTPKALQQELAKSKILIRDCSNFDMMGDGYVRFAVRSDADIRVLCGAFCGVERALAG